MSNTTTSLRRKAIGFTLAGDNVARFETSKSLIGQSSSLWTLMHTNTRRWTLMPNWKFLSLSLSLFNRNAKHFYPHTQTNCAQIQRIFYPSIYPSIPLKLASHTELACSLFQSAPNLIRSILSDLGGQQTATRISSKFYQHCGCLKLDGI